jgi:hypothetical protein
LITFCDGADRSHLTIRDQRPAQSHHLPWGRLTRPPVSSCIYLWLSPELFDRNAFEQLHEKTRETIAKSPEYEAIVSHRPLEISPETVPDDLNDSIPF